MTGTPLKDCRQKTLKCINCRPFLMAVCALVVVECACVLAELMIDLQGIKFRFENEETEINRFVSYLRQRYPDVFKTEDMRTMADVINVLEKSIVLRSPRDLLLDESLCTCECPCNESSTRMESDVKETLSDKISVKSPPLSKLQPINDSSNLELRSSSDQIHLSQGHENDVKSVPFLLLSDSFTYSSLYSSSSFELSSPETVSQHSSFVKRTHISSSESKFVNNLYTPHSPTPELENTGIFSDYLSSNQASLNDILESTTQIYNLKTRNFDSKLGIEENAVEQVTKTVPIVDIIPTILHQNSNTPSSITTNDASDGTISNIVSTPLINRRLLWIDAIASSLFSDSENVAARSLEEYPASSLRLDSSVQKIQSNVQQRVHVSGHQANSKTDTRKISSESSTVIQSSKVEDNMDSLTNIKSCDCSQYESTTSMFPPEHMTHKLSHFVTLLSNLSHMIKSKLLIAKKETTPFSLNLTKEETDRDPPETTGHFPKLNLKDTTDPSSKSDPHLMKAMLIQSQPALHGSSSLPASIPANISSVQRTVSLQDIFILEINNLIDSFFLVAEFVPEQNSVNRTKFIQNTMEYSKIYKASKALHFISLSILSVMVLETAVKLFCTGCAFFKRKFEVFDAFIVVSSFALDFVFLDSRWYETGKDATTILVLLLPWRVVRIVNSFLMTMKHKHHLQMMNMKRSKKKAELKSAKLQTLLSEIRKDVQLLVVLCRANGIEEKDITACLYGKGRRSVTLSAMSTCTSLMLISTLGKDSVQEDEIYGKVFKEAFNEGDIELDADIMQAEEAAIDAAIELDEELEARRKSRKYKSKKFRVQRSYTVPRRSASVEIPEPDINENSSNIFYINDGFFNTRSSSPRSSDIVMLGPGPDLTKITGAASGGSLSSKEDELRTDDSSSWRTVTPAPSVPARSKFKSVASMKSLPKKGNNTNRMVTFEVTTQVTYL